MLGEAVIFWVHCPTCDEIISRRYAKRRIDRVRWAIEMAAGWLSLLRDPTASQIARYCAEMYNQLVGGRTDHENSIVYGVPKEGVRNFDSRRKG